MLGTVKLDEAFDTVEALEIFAVFLVDDDIIAEVDDVHEYCCCCSLTEVVATADETDLVVGSVYIYVIAPMNIHYFV